MTISVPFVKMKINQILKDDKANIMEIKRTRGIASRKDCVSIGH